jgi:hypothetical protein
MIMARKKLTKAALDFIIEKRNDWHVNYTFADIAKLLKEDFGITITEQAVSKSYRKHKDDDAFRTLQVGKQDSESNLGIQKKCKDVPEKVKSQRVNEPIIPDIIGKDFDENAGKNYDVNDFFMKE